MPAFSVPLSVPRSAVLPDLLFLEGKRNSSEAKGANRGNRLPVDSVLRLRFDARSERANEWEDRLQPSPYLHSFTGFNDVESNPGPCVRQGDQQAVLDEEQDVCNSRGGKKAGSLIKIELLSPPPALFMPRKRAFPPSSLGLRERGCKA